MFEKGIKVDTKVLEELKFSNNNTIQNLITSIYEAAGSEFNINAPKQLGSILFETLKLPPSKKTKTGYSTNEVVLHKLYDEHEIIPLLLKYREAFKLQSTYIEPLLELALKNDVVTMFCSCDTNATGSTETMMEKRMRIATESLNSQKKDAKLKHFKATEMTKKSNGPSSGCHIVFVLDESGSMNGNPWNKTKKSPHLIRINYPRLL